MVYGTPMCLRGVCPYTQLHVLNLSVFAYSNDPTTEAGKFFANTLSLAYIHVFIYTDWFLTHMCTRWYAQACEIKCN